MICMTVKYVDTTDVQTVASPSLRQSMTRLTGIDALRGLVMVIMALDHVRDFFHDGAMVFSPEDLTRTTPILFFTRWITHVCAPVFVFLAGVGAFLRHRRNGPNWQLSRFLLIRGLWLVLLEVTVMRLAFNFTFSPQYPVLLLVLWALGVSMIALAVLIYLPTRVLALASITVIGLHNLFDGFLASQFGALSGAWTMLHPARRLHARRHAFRRGLSGASVGGPDGRRLLFRSALRSAACRATPSDRDDRRDADCPVRASPDYQRLR
jgi:uncharacterized membrane protein